MLDLEGEAHEIWAMAQLSPNEGIENGVDRIKKELEELAKQADNTGKQQCLCDFCKIDDVNECPKTWKK